MTQTEIPTLDDIDDAFAAIVVPDFSDERQPSPARADLSGYLAIHTAMRVANEQLVRGIGTARVVDRTRAAALGRWFRGYSDELRTHHHIEDDIVFPELAERVPAYAAVYSEALAGDHHHLDRVIDALREALGLWAQHSTETERAREDRYLALDLAVELRDLLEEHLAIEDADVLPMIEQHFTYDEYAELERQAGKAITIRQAMFTAPWYMATIDEQTAARTWTEAPLALKVIYKLTRRSYARLAERAFGEPAMIRISLRDLQWRRRRFVIVVLVASLAFGLALVMTGVTNQLSNEGNNTIAMFGADRWVVAEGVRGPFTTSQLVDQRLSATIAEQPGVEAASPILVGRTLIGDKDVNVVGYDPDSEILPQKLADALGGVTDPHGAIADVRFDYGVGETFDLGGARVPVVAQVRDTSFYFSMPTVFLPLPVVQDLLYAGQRVASAIVVTGQLTPADVAGLGGSVTLLGNDDVRADYDRVLKSTKDTIGIINTLLWLMAAGIVAAIVYVSVLERTRDFATLKAIGTSNRALVFGLIGQAAVVSVASALAAVGVARAISPTFSFPVSVPSGAYVQMLVVAMVVGVLASLAGIRRIARIDPALAFGGAS